jgi:hypothetical protein
MWGKKKKNSVEVPAVVEVGGKSWFTKDVGGVPTALDRFEALDLLNAIHKEIQLGNIGKAMKLSGMNPAPFGEPESLEQLTQAFTVRMHDLMRYAGLSDEDR